MTDIHGDKILILDFGAQYTQLIARRIRDDGPEIILPGCAWQMPQGGIDPDEDAEAAAKRELWEETGVTSVAVLGQVDEWLEAMALTSICGLGQGAPVPVRNAFRHWPELWGTMQP